MPFSIYIHFPYCKSRCPYCDFFRALKPRDFDEDALVARYLNDLEYFEPYMRGREVKSIFFGGGTPSLLSPRAVGKVLEGIDHKFSILNQAEISLEANPNTFEQEKFRAFRGAGINRLSLGVQALQSEGLKFLGRTHSLDDALKAMALGSEVFPKFSIDLIYARPRQQWEDWVKEIDLALSFGLKHISLYQLTLEEGTIFYKKNIEVLDEEQAATLYDKTVLYLRSKGLERYEVSNFASLSQESVHNLVYWQGGDYIGLGEGAHGRFCHNHNIYASLDGRISETLTSYERAEELLLMGLRIKEGIFFDRFYQACGVNLQDIINVSQRDYLVHEGLLVVDTLGIQLTDSGFFVLDEIVRRLVS